MTKKTDRMIQHDISEALRTLTFAVAELKQGYRFEDELGPDKILALDRAIQILVTEYEYFLNAKRS